MQLGIRTINSIESFEFYQGSDYMMTASLRYPIDQTLALIDKKVVEGKTRLGDIKSSLSEFKTIFYLISVIALINILVN